MEDNRKCDQEFYSELSQVVDISKHSTRAIIKQDDLEEFIVLSRDLRDSERRWRQKYKYLSDALRAGATVEPGMHEAFLAKLVVR